MQQQVHVCIYIYKGDDSVCLQGRGIHSILMETVDMTLQIPFSCKTRETHWALVGFFARVCSHVSNQVWSKSHLNPTDCTNMFSFLFTISTSFILVYASTYLLRLNTALIRVYTFQNICEKFSIICHQSKSIHVKSITQLPCCDLNCFGP